MSWHVLTDFGQEMPPAPEILIATTAAPTLEAFVEPVHIRREVKGNLTCAQPGCSADVLLQIYNPTEAGKVP